MKQSCPGSIPSDNKSFLSNKFKQQGIVDALVCMLFTETSCLKTKTIK